MTLPAQMRVARESVVPISMRSPLMKRILLLCLAIVLFATTAAAQKDQKEKPWTEWNEKEVMKVLSDSAWAQSQKELTDSTGSGGSAITTAAQNGNSANPVMSDAAKANSE